MRKLFSSLLTSLLLTVCSIQFFSPLACNAQQQTAQQYLVTLNAPPSQVTQANVTLTGQGGGTTYFYWIVTKSTVGASVPAGPFLIRGASDSLSGTNFNTVSWTGVQGGTNYDILRTSSNSPPSGACICAVATAQTSGQVNDQSNSLSVYTVAPVNTGNLILGLQNEAQSSGVSHLILRQNGVFVGDLSSAAAGVASWPIVTGGTNTGNAFLVGNGSTFGAAGTGTITATAMPASGLTGQVAVGNGGTGQNNSAPSFTPGAGQTFFGLAQATNNYVEGALQNTSAGTGASTDFTVSNNLGTNTTNYADFGINSSTFTGSGPINIAGGAYVYNQSGDLSLGTEGSNILHLFVNNADWMTVSGAAAGHLLTGNTLTIDAGATLTCSGTCTGFSSPPAFSSITSGTNAIAAMLVGTGASLAASGSGTITATAVPFSGNTASTNTAALVIGTGGSLGTSGSGTITATAAPFSGLTGSTNTTAAMLVGTGASLAASGSGTITATAMPFSGNTASTNTAALVIGTGGSLGTSGSGTITATAVPFSGVTSGTNTTTLTSTGTIDFTGTTLAKLRVGAGLTTTVNGDIGYDTTNLMWHAYENGADSLIGTIPVATSITSGHCVSWLKSTNTYTLNDAGVCGSATPAFSSLTGGTNTGAAMVVGTGASLAASGSGTITATAMPFSGNTASTNTAALVIGTGGSLGTSGSGTITATAVPFSGVTSGTNTTTLTSTGTIDFTGTTLAKLRVGAGLTTTVNGDIGYDTTNLMWHAYENGADSLIGTIPVATSITSGHCVSWLKSTNTYTLNDAGGACASGTPSFSAISSGTNTTGPLTVGTGSSIAFSGTGQITSPLVQTPITFTNANSTITGTGAASSSPTLTISTAIATSGTVAGGNIIFTGAAGLGSGSAGASINATTGASGAGGTNTVGGTFTFTGGFGTGNANESYTVALPQILASGSAAQSATNNQLVLNANGTTTLSGGAGAAYSGPVTISTTTAISGTSAGATLSLLPAAGRGTAVGGQLTATAGTGGSGGSAGGQIVITGGTGGSVGGNGGAVSFTGGQSDPSGGNGGAATIAGGTGFTSGNGGAVNINGGATGATLGTNISGGNITATTGAGTGTAVETFTVATYQPQLTGNSAQSVTQNQLVISNNGTTSLSGSTGAAFSGALTLQTVVPASGGPANGGLISVLGGAGLGSGAAGAGITETAGAAASAGAGNGGAMLLTSGASLGGTGAGGAMTISAGASGNTTGAGGAASLTSGANSTAGASGALTIASGTSAGATTGAVTITSGATTGGTNQVSGGITLNCGVGTGTGKPALCEITTANSDTASGTTANTPIITDVFDDTVAALTSASPSTLFTCPLATLQGCGGVVDVYIFATDGTNQCVLAGTFAYAGENSAGVFVVAPTAAALTVLANSCTTGKTLTATVSMTGANPSLIQITPTTTITTTKFYARYKIRHLGNTSITP